VFAQALLEAPKGVFQIVLSALKESAPGYIAASLQRLVSVPEPNADALLQLARESFNGRLDAVEGAPPVGRIFEKLLAYTDKTERLRAGGAAGVPNIRPRVKVLFEARKYEVVRKHFQEVDRTNARNTYMRILSSHAIDDGVKEAARVVVARRFPDLLKEKQQYFWEDDNLIFTTRDGLRKLEAELDELLNVRVPENQRAIGAAAAHGDLSENAEYTAALEERDQLIRRAGRVRGEVESARLLEEAEIPVGLVSPGSRVELTEIDTDESRAYTILGPWDVDLEAGVISYTAPLVKGLLGCRPGDEARIVLPGGEEQRFKVLAVEPVLGLHGQDG
jgi:transcription elongation GreA/GreB family factor